MLINLVCRAVLAGENSEPHSSLADRIIEQRKQQEAEGKVPDPKQWMDHLEMGLPDDVIIALADFKFETLEQNAFGAPIRVKCTGQVSRFIIGTDQNKNIEFECDMSAFPRFAVPVKPAGELDGASDALAVYNGDPANNCLMVYKRTKEGDFKAIRFHSRGLDMLPVYEWLQSTKDRKGDRAALSVLVLMDKSAPKEVRNLAYRVVTSSNLTFKTRFEIMTKAIGLGVSREDIEYGIYSLWHVPASPEETTKEEKHNRYVTLLRYCLDGLIASKDVRDANIWLTALSQYAPFLNTPGCADLCKEIAEGVKKHEVTPAPDLAQDMARYDKLRRLTLAHVEGQQRMPETPPAPPASDKAADRNVSTPNMPRWLRPIEAGLPDDAIVALVDFKADINMYLDQLALARVNWKGQDRNLDTFARTQTFQGWMVVQFINQQDADCGARVRLCHVDWQIEWVGKIAFANDPKNDVPNPNVRGPGDKILQGPVSHLNNNGLAQPAGIQTATCGPTPKDAAQTR
jgi:hypothetical protein